MKKISFITAAILSLTVFASCGQKAQFTVGLDASFPPMGFEQNGQIVGFDIDLAKEVAKRLNMQVKFQPISWDAKVMELNNKTIDCIWNGFTITSEMSQQVLFTKPYLNNTQIIVVKSDSTIASKADLVDKQIGVQSGSSSYDAVSADTSIAPGNIKQYDTEVLCLQDLLNGRIDAAVVDEVVGQYYITDMKQTDKYKVLTDNFGNEVYGVGFRLSDAALKDSVEKTLDDMKADGTFKQISMKWFGEDKTAVVPLPKN